ncbi:hypothetical protein [Kytococcus sp. Marseille-QA3725]
MSTPPPAVRRPRLVSLDWSRGTAVVFNLLMIAVLPPLPAALKHARWEGVHLVDLVFPSFVVLSGAGMAFAYARTPSWWVVLRRSSVLWAAGLVYNGVVLDWPPLAEFRLMGPLQVYAVLVPLVAVASTRLRTTRAWAAGVVALLVVLGATHLAWGTHCGGVSPECNPSRVLDLPWMGAHAYRGGALGHDPEGLVTLAGALVTAGVGLVAGSTLRTLHGAPGIRRRIVARLLVLVGACVAGGLVLQLLGVPLVKRLWTPSFALLSAVPGLLVLLGGYLLLDAEGAPLAGSGHRWVAAGVRSVPEALGRNALLGYFGSHLVLHWLTLGDPSVADRVAGVLGGDAGRWLFGSVFLGFWVVLAVVLARHRVYVRP